MYAPLIPSNPITVTESSVFDKVIFVSIHMKITKVVTIMFVFVGVLLTIIISILHGKINVTSNESEYNDQVGVIGYVAMNINSLPIKKLLHVFKSFSVFFRDISCDASEETTKLFPWDNMVLMTIISQEFSWLLAIPTTLYLTLQNYELHRCDWKMSKWWTIMWEVLCPLFRGFLLPNYKGSRGFIW